MVESNDPEVPKKKFMQKGKGDKEKHEEKITALGQVKVGPTRSSTLTLFHRPTHQTLLMLQSMKGLNYVITAQSEHENWQAVKALCDELQINHFHIDLNGANEALLSNPETLKYLESRLEELF
jgi:hypothetical protein